MNEASFIAFIETSSNDRTYRSDDGQYEARLKSTRTNEYGTGVQNTFQGWKCPSMYHDSPDNEDSGHLDQWWPGEGKGLFLVYDSDDYAQIVYLCLQVLDRDTLRVVCEYNGRKPEKEILLRRLP